MPTSASVVEVLWEGMAKTLRDATDVWKDEEQGVLRAQATELLLQASLDLLRVTQQLVARKWDDLFSMRIRAVQAAGDHLEQAVATARRLAEGTCELVDAEAHTVEKSSLQAELVRLVETQSRLARHWPRFDLSRLEQRRAQAARGEFVEAEEIYREFPELQSASQSRAASRHESLESDAD